MGAHREVLNIDIKIFILNRSVALWLKAHEFSAWLTKIDMIANIMPINNGGT